MSLKSSSIFIVNWYRGLEVTARNFKFKRERLYGWILYIKHSIMLRCSSRKQSLDIVIGDTCEYWIYLFIYLVTKRYVYFQLQVTPETCLLTLEFASWDVHRAIKLVRLRSLGRSPDVPSLLACAAALDGCGWDVARAAALLAAHRDEQDIAQV